MKEIQIPICMKVTLCQARVLQVGMIPELKPNDSLSSTRPTSTYDFYLVTVGVIRPAEIYPNQSYEELHRVKTCLVFHPENIFYRLISIWHCCISVNGYITNLIIKDLYKTKLNLCFPLPRGPAPDRLGLSKDTFSLLRSRFNGSHDLGID